MSFERKKERALAIMESKKCGAATMLRLCCVDYGG